jgi:cell fate regulator YaaT (PSP1 superfamily)
VYAPSCNKLNATDWLKEIKPPDAYPANDIVEVRFKNSRKDFFRAPPELDLKTGDIVAVEASPGHDIGIVTLTGEVVKLQLKKKKINYQNTECKKVYRKAKISDIEKWVGSVKQEDNTMLRSRGMASSLRLSMKISDVEYQGDRTKATFYYTADDRVDFRELIRVLADSFGVRIEMRQIGMRQEASRLGGIGSCGRELCCATWLTQFRSVSTNAARNQQLSLNPQKLAGQCSKLKCCINYENDCYTDALQQMTEACTDLQTRRGKAMFQKMDVLRKMLGYSYADNPHQLIMISLDRASQVLEMNRNNQSPEDLEDENQVNLFQEDSGRQIDNSLEDSLTRFDKPEKKKKKKRKSRGRSSQDNNKP